MISPSHIRSGAARFLRLVSLCFFGLFLTVAGLAAEAVKKNFNISADDAARALKQFAAQSGEQLLYSPSDVAGVKTLAVQGEFTAREALGKMLDGTTLVAAQDKSTGALAVRTETPAESKNVPGRPAEAAAAEQAPSARLKDGVVRLDTYEVFGAKSINTDLPRTRDDTQPYVVFNRQQIEQSNASSLNDFFRTRLPMNNTGAGVPVNYSGAASNSAINLRGLGTNQTLVLVDGRRVPSVNPGAAGTSASQGDINGIPLSMIERIEILPSTASGIHGGGATGGVINIITRKDYFGVEATVSYTNAFDTDASLHRVDLNGSFALQGGKTFLTFSSSYSDGTSLLVQDRDFSRRARALLLANNPAAIYAAGVTPLVGYTTNIRNSTAANLVLKPQFGGTVLSSPYAQVPVGFAGISTGNVAGLVAAAGTYNLDLPNTSSSGGLSSVISVPQIKSWALGGRHKFGANVETYLDISSLTNIGQAPNSSVSATSATLAATAPNNPFTTAVVVAYPATNLPANTSTQGNYSNRIAAGVVVRLPWEWTAGADYVWSRGRYRLSVPASLVGDPDGTAGPRIAYATALAAGTVDVLRDLNSSPIDYTPYLMPQPTQFTDNLTTGQQGTLRAAGPVWQLPGGPLTVALSVDWRREEVPSAVFQSVSVFPPLFTWWPLVAVDQGSAYLETRVPVFSEKSTSLLRALEFQASVRYDTYRSRGPTATSGIRVDAADGVPTTPYPMLIRRLNASSGMAGFKYSPIKDVALRVSAGTGFLPPSLAQLRDATPFDSPGTVVVDPKRGNVSANTGPLIILMGGNSQLNPEFSESLSAGVIFTPRFLPGLRLSVDWTQIHKRDEIASLQAQQSLDYEDVIPGQVVRAPLTAADQALGYTGGRITTLSAFRSLNFARRELTAYDVQLEYEVRIAALGNFRPYITASHQPRFASQVVPNAPLTNSVGFTGPLKWRGNGGLDWSRGRWSAGWNMQYYDSYIGRAATATVATAAAFVLNQGTATIPSQTYHDIYAGYDFGIQAQGWRRYLSNTRLTAGVQNAFNTSPPIIAGTAALQGFSPYGDPRLARYTLTLRKRF